MESDDFRAFIREERLRSERVWRGVMDELRQLHEASREHSAEIRALSREIHDMRDEGHRMREDARDEARAQREGLFKLIDKINELGNRPNAGPAPA